VQVNALVTLYNTSHGAQWKSKTHWLSGDSCGNTWTGVVCNANSEIAHLCVVQAANAAMLPLLWSGCVTVCAPSCGTSHASPTALRSLESNSICGTIPSELASPPMGVPDNVSAA
jgi:hypothetical protein